MAGLAILLHARLGYEKAVRVQQFFNMCRPNLELCWTRPSVLGVVSYIKKRHMTMGKFIQSLDLFVITVSCKQWRLISLY